MTGSFERIEVITGVAGRRRWSVEEKLRMVAESLMPDMPVSAVARRHGVRSNLLFKWRRLAREGAFGPLPDSGPSFVPIRLMPEPPSSPLGAAPGSLAGQAADCMVEIALPNGCRLRVSAEIDGRALRRLVTALKAAIALPAGSKIYLSLQPVDMRKGFDGLAAQVQQILARDPFSGHLFLFHGRCGDRLKALWWDGGGLCLFAKRLERGRFVWPRVEEGAITLTPAQLAMLIEGLDWRRAVTFKDLPTPTAV